MTRIRRPAGDEESRCCCSCPDKRLADKTAGKRQGKTGTTIRVTALLVADDRELVSKPVVVVVVLLLSLEAVIGASA